GLTRENNSAPIGIDYAPPIVGEVLQSAGQRLDSRTGSRMTQQFGYDFGRVRVHNDARANESAKAVNCHAYTVGEHIVFGRGGYAPSTAAGQKLLAHELAHVVQQTTAPAGNPSCASYPSKPLVVFRQAAPAAVQTDPTSILDLSPQERLKIEVMDLTISND